MALVDEQACVTRNECVGPELYLMTMTSPCIAEVVCPGQFVHMAVPGMEAHLLRRPFSIYAHDASRDEIEVLYRVVGFGTKRASELSAGAYLDLIGPVGRPWAPGGDTRRALLVGGGVGAAPLFMLSETLLDAGASVDVVLGAQSADCLVCRDRFEALIGHKALCSTDDGTFGSAGFATSIVVEELDKARDEGDPYDYVAACGPVPLMRATAEAAHGAGARCEVCLERRMACGIGACLSCVVETISGKMRACVDGPVFDAKEIVW